MTATGDVKQNSKSSRANGAPAPNPAPAPDAPADDGWRKVQTERPQWKPGEAGQSQTVQGYLVSRIDDLPLPKPKTLPSGEVMTTWAAFVMRLTQPAKTSPAFGDGVVDVPAGTEILIGEAAKLADLRRALSPKVLIELRITDLGKVDIGGGKTIRRFDVATNDKTAIVRPPSLSMGAVGARVLSLPPAPAALPDDGIPF